jgi:ligand-binding sensor domain-containing protein
MKRKLSAIAAVAAGIAGFGGYSVWRAHQELGTSRTDYRRSTELAYQLRQLDRSNVPGMDLVASRASLLDAVFMEGRLYTLTAQGLTAFDASGRAVASYRCGFELPGAPLAGLAAGMAPGSREPEIFIATSGAGVLFFDGKSFRQLLPEASAARRITALLPLDSGQLLIGTDKAGLLVWDGSRLTWFHDSVKHVPITALAGQLDSLWIGTMDRGVIHAHAGQITSYHNLPDTQVLALAVQGERAWAGTSLGVAELTAGGQSRVIAEGVFAKSLQVENGVLIVGTLEEGLLEAPLDARQPRPRSAASIHGRGEVHRLKPYESGVLAVMADGVLLRESGKWRKLELESGAEGGLTDTNISAVAVEDTGRVWVGYFDRGLDVWDPRTGRVAHFEDEHLFCVNRIALRRDGAAIATANGLVLTDRAGKTRQVLTKSEGLIANHATDVLLDDTGMVVATPAGITFLNSSGTFSIYAFHGLVNNHVYALAAAGGRLFAGTLGGLSVLEGGTVKASYTTANSMLRHNWISAATAAGDQVFAGTYGAGVYRFDGATWHGFPDLREGFEVNPNSMASTEGAVFAGTLTRGLAIYNRANGRWNFFTSGLPSGNVTAVAAGSGNLFIGTDNGLVRMPEGSVPLP